MFAHNRGNILKINRLWRTQSIENTEKNRKEGGQSRWKRHIVVNSMQARLRAQLGDRSKYSGERRRRSVVVASIVLTITDPLRGSYPLLCNLQAALIRSCGASFACMELTIISRFQRLQTSRKYSLHSLFYSFSVLSPSACFQIANTFQIGYQNKPKNTPKML